jgi:hypothetical protein
MVEASVVSTTHHRVRRARITKDGFKANVSGNIVRKWATRWSGRKLGSGGKRRVGACYLRRVGQAAVILGPRAWLHRA